MPTSSSHTTTVGARARAGGGRPRGRKPRVTPEILDAIESAIISGDSDEKIARRFDMSRSTIQRARRRLYADTLRELADGIAWLVQRRRLSEDDAEAVLGTIAYVLATLHVSGAV